MSNLKNTNLDVARFAINCVEYAIDISNKVEPKKYKTLVKKMPTLIQKNGFINTLVFNLSKIDKTYHKEVLKNIVIWNKENLKIKDIKDYKKIFQGINDEYIEKDSSKLFQNYIKWVTSLEQMEYRLVAKEMIILFSWIKRFADGMIQDEGE
ncbi:MAG: type III-B CRISPR module-associated protein Cmr5 [Clostridium cochlearium]|uniref:type III-B CRISPR module-associated protein Cmr5 n=1 Tax=Clostridium cochlearium TaxID=1494 RepID=UPI00280B53ED|nr:type III-B CRISPR module-associated protein Cmr5 [Clostridium cochlearium]MDU1443028.1 type III-B CRISPR module-associated protein Cmr5 [Clostridium cochlearium]